MGIRPGWSQRGIGQASSIVTTGTLYVVCILYAPDIMHTLNSKLGHFYCLQVEHKRDYVPHRYMCTVLYIIVITLTCNEITCISLYYTISPVLFEECDPNADSSSV